MKCAGCDDIRKFFSLRVDFVPIEEGVFCDMETLEVLPICKDDDAKKCLDVEKRQTKRKDTEGVNMYMPAKAYANVMKWKCVAEGMSSITTSSTT